MIIHVGMQGKKWKKYRQRLLPTIEFIQHMSVRLFQVLSRIGILSLFWTVVGGLGFGILCFIEI